jgi:transposase
MLFHRNAKVGLAGRHALVCAVEGGMSLKQAATAFSVSPATAHRWWHRWLEAEEEARRTLSCLFDRSSRPHRSPRQLAPELEQAICACRRQTGWGPRLVAGATGFAHSTVWKVLHRAGISRAPRAAREPANRYEWPYPGDLLHMDVSRYARFLRPGHRVTGDRSHRVRHWMRSETRVGYDYLHAVVDDHSRLAYAELHEDEKAATVTGFVERALAFFAEHGIVAKRLMTDNAFAYVRSRAARAAQTARHPPPHHQAVPAPHQRQGRALPPNDGPRMGLRARLPLISTTQPSAATLAQPLQPAKTTQLNRRPTPDQPRSQRPWVGQLATPEEGRQLHSRPGSRVRV